MPNPVSPVYRQHKEFEFNLAENQKEYIPIPTLVVDGPEKRFVSRWRFTEEERNAIRNGADLIFQQLTFGHPFQPVAFMVESQEKETEPDDSCLCNGVGCNNCCART